MTDRPEILPGVAPPAPCAATRPAVLYATVTPPPPREPGVTLRDILRQRWRKMLAPRGKQRKRKGR